MEVIVRFKKQIWILFFAGIIMLVIVYLLAPDKSEQVIDTLTIFGVLFIMIFFFLIILLYFQEERRRQ